jgi:hypothetical protein
MAEACPVPGSAALRDFHDATQQVDPILGGDDELARLQVRGRSRAHAVIRQRGDRSGVDHVRLLQVTGPPFCGGPRPVVAIFGLLLPGFATMCAP